MLEGRTGGCLTWETERRRSFASDNRLTSRLTGQWMIARDTAFLDTTLWDAAGTAELIHSLDWSTHGEAADWRVRVTYGGGIVYISRDVGTRLDREYDIEPFGRATASAAVRRSVGDGTWRVGARAFAGGYLASNAPVKQRAVPVNGADPYETFGNPLVRSHGAIFVRPEFFYHSPGNGNLRGFAPGLGGRWLAALNVELERYVARRGSGVVRSASLVAFGDAAIVDTLAVPSSNDDILTPLLDAGVGARVTLNIGDLTFPVRIGLPLYVSRPTAAHNRRQGVDPFEFRWFVSFEPIF